MRAVAGNVLIEVKPRDEMVGSIVVVQDNKENYSYGVVVSVGNLCNVVGVGDQVVFPTYIGNDLKYDGKQLKVIDEKHIFAIV